MDLKNSILSGRSQSLWADDMAQWINVGAVIPDGPGSVTDRTPSEGLTGRDSLGKTPVAQA